MYHPLFCLRRLVLVVGLFYLEGVLQAATGAVLSLGMLVYLLKYLPFEGKLLNALNVIGEIIIFICWLLLLFNSFEFSDSANDAIAWVIISITLLFLVCSYLVYIVMTIVRKLKPRQQNTVRVQVVTSNESKQNPELSPSSEQLFVPVPLAYDYNSPRTIKNHSPSTLSPPSPRD